MLPDIVEARPLEAYRLFVRFADGVEGTIDVQEFAPLEGVFAPLRNPDEFRRVAVNSELGTVSWPSGADLDPLLIYARLTGGEVVSVDAHVDISRR